MGHNPIPPARPPDRESFHLGRAREAYARGEITLERFEELAEHVLRGGYLSARLEPVREGIPEPVNYVQVWRSPWGESVPPPPDPRLVRWVKIQ